MNEDNNKNEEKNELKKNIIIIILIIIILLLLLLFFLFKFKKDVIPTGNVDIFEIECNNNCDCDNKITKGGNIKVNDYNIEWETESKLRIFENPVYNMDEIIAPGSSNIYQFVVKNNTDDEILYNMIFDEENKYKINMKYRLLRDKEYVAGSKKTWVSFDELNLSNVSLDYENEHTYYLEWKWVEDQNDTKIGSSYDANYSLKINIKAAVFDDEI